MGGDGHLVCLICLMMLSVTQSVASNDLKIVHYELERKWLWPNFKVLSWHLPEGAEENHETLKIVSAKIQTRNLVNTNQKC